LEPFAAEISYLYNTCRVWTLKHALCMIFRAFWPWIFEFYVRLKSLICTTFAGCWNLIMQFAWYLNRFGLESLACTVLAASWSQHLCYTGCYLHDFVIFATYCLELVLGSVSGWLGCIWGLLLVYFKFSVRLVWACVFLIVLRFKVCIWLLQVSCKDSFKIYFGVCYSVDLGLVWCLFGVGLKLL